ncbi:(2z,6z)-farnesyl diphosphate synthase, chloroplastic, partial [Nicotiana attenuata]
IIALNNGGHYDMLEATKSIASKVKDGLLRLEDIDYKLFEQELSTKCPKRAKNRESVTSYCGNCLTLNYTSKKKKILFPHFGEELKKAIRSFQQHSRFGGHTY